MMYWTLRYTAMSDAVCVELAEWRYDDWDRVPDLESFGRGIRAALECGPTRDDAGVIYTVALTHHDDDDEAMPVACYAFGGCDDGTHYYRSASAVVLEHDRPWSAIRHAREALRGSGVWFDVLAVLERPRIECDDETMTVWILTTTPDAVCDALPEWATGECLSVESGPLLRPRP